MGKIKIFNILLIVTFLIVNISFAEKQESPQPTAQSPKLTISPLDKLTREEILEKIKYMLEISPEIANFIPELEDIDLEKLDKESLIKVYNRVNIERIRLQTERIQRQLEAIKTFSGPPKTPASPPSPPAISTPPSPPQPSRR